MTAAEPLAIDLRGVAMRYGGSGGTLAARDVTLSVRRGEFVAIVGPSGCGKSTLLRLVAGLMPPAAGTALISGAAPRATGNTGIAFQNPSLLLWRTVLQNVLLPLEVSPQHKAAYRRDPAPFVARAKRLLAAVGLGDFLDKHPWELSGGMQQRVNLVRSLIHAPAFLLLDEPFSALDAFTREELWLALQALWMGARPTVILVTHDLREATLLADTVYVMSPRPGTFTAQHDVTFARPRTLEDTFTPAFIDVVHELRAKVGGLRSPIRAEELMEAVS
ncbi:NitT/TauT family transport system ATP-binding protein [Deinococcus metalli]|uniref:NitT/TauT family transport system ATP-binding protein n=1 Tax=Deinococcus metalli TaxID=1141878 RepID=A0A7W8KEU3_9DEIO|nr:ABC transporter ATP-binding protein [Deinococcus metalli]MBB5375721.1 NitT/TauT family transport system ATP-binding protein [Deinococcus metalli]GHF37545.1 nitrate ABC transporter ATP-binding protein [Deinococcus metalli]